MLVLYSGLFIWFSFYLRLRFVKENKLSFLLRLPVFPLVLWVVFLICVSSYIVHYLNLVLIDSLSLRVFWLVTMVIVVFVLGFRTFLLAKGPIPGTYLSYTIKGELCVNVNKKLFPEGRAKSDLIEFVIGCAQQIVSMENIYWRTLIIKSHLIGDGFRKVMKATLDDCKDVTFTCGPWKTRWDVQVMLNLVYGGITRYRLLSFRKHANGFKVHEVGSHFTIQRVEGAISIL